MAVAEKKFDEIVKKLEKNGSWLALAALRLAQNPTGEKEWRDFDSMYRAASPSAKRVAMRDLAWEVVSLAFEIDSWRKV